MKRTILTFALAAGGLLVAAGAADAQYPYRVPTQSYSFNPWGVTPSYGVTTYSPYSGLRSQTYGFNNWTGTQYYQSSFANPYTGYRQSYGSAYNPFFNQYQYQYNYNYGFPRMGWQSGYWR